MKAAGLNEYYSRRAAEYEEIYNKPERQRDLVQLRTLLRRLLARHVILEIACGTGFWTEAVAPVAQSILATDTSEEVLAIAKSKSYPDRRVHFALADAYNLHDVEGEFTATLAAFWWSHIPKQRIAEFLHGLHQRLGTGATVVFIDNRYVEGSSTPLSDQNEMGNTYQIRRLNDGSTHRVLKNFPSPDELSTSLDNVSNDLVISQLEYYWCASYKIANS